MFYPSVAFYDVGDHTYECFKLLVFDQSVLPDRALVVYEEDASAI